MAKIKNSGGGCLTAFGSIFLLVGLGVGFLGLKPIWKNLTSQSWQQVPATILEVDMQRNTGDSDSADTYKVLAKYRYQWEGKSYNSDKVSFGTGSDSFEDYHRELRSELSSYVNNENAYKAWVNPNNPIRW